jgi:putative tryptophan/tyrosine transport system substrate-binding protein
MNSKLFWVALGAMVLALSFHVQAQQPGKIPRIGYLTGASPSTISSRIEAFRQGLRELGYVEGKNIVIEWRYAEGKLESLPALATELARFKIDVIVTGGPGATRLAKEATVTIPIVMAQDSDPVGNGFVASLARPGGNIPGLSVLSPELSGKRLEILKEVVPKLSRLAVIGGTDPGTTQALKETERAARSLGVQIQYLQIGDPNDIDRAFRTARNEHDAVLLLTTVVATSQRRQFVDAAIKNRLPVTYFRREFVEDGGLMSYGVSYTDMDRRAATFVDKILKGAKPADLPIEQPTKFELVINLKTAKQIGLTIPPNVLARADKVIK